MSSLPQKDANPKPSAARPGEVPLRVRPDGAFETLDGRPAPIVETETADNFHLSTGKHARALMADLAELHKLRLQNVGGSVYKRSRSSVWQIKYLVAGKWVQQSSRTSIKKDAEALLRERVYLANAGTLPGTVSFETIVDALVADRRILGNKAVARLAGAAKALKLRFEGSRAEDLGYDAWRKYADARRHKDGRAADTVNLEISVARSAYKLARKNGSISKVPDFPHLKPRIRQGFVDPAAWKRLREQLRPDFRDAADFAFYSGAREMEVLTLRWTDIEPAAVHLAETKSGRPRAIPYRELPELAAVIERRAAVAEALKRAAVIAPWVFCFRENVVVRGRIYHRAGGELFKSTGQRGLPALLRDEWSKACASVGLPGLLFHDLRRSAARNFERAGWPRSVAMKLGGWTDKIYSRYAIGAESEIAPLMPKLSAYLRSGR